MGGINQETIAAGIDPEYHVIAAKERIGNSETKEYRKKYYPGIDLIKFIMSLVVVAIHTGLLETVRGEEIIYNTFLHWQFHIFFWLQAFY